MAKVRRGRMVESCILDEDGVAGWDGSGARRVLMRGGLFGRRYVWKEVCLRGLGPDMMGGLGALYDCVSLLSSTGLVLLGDAGSRFYDLNILLDGPIMTPRTMPSQLDAYLLP